MFIFHFLYKKINHSLLVNDGVRRVKRSLYSWLRSYSPSTLLLPQTDPLIEERASFVHGGCPVSGPTATTPIDDDHLITVFQLKGPLGRLADVQTNIHGVLEQQGLRAITIIYSTRDSSNGSPPVCVWEDFEGSTHCIVLTPRLVLLARSPIKQDVSYRMLCAGCLNVG